MHLALVMSYINLDPEHSLNYAPSFGVMKLRQTWQTQLFGKNPSLVGKEVSLPIVTNGITHGLSVTADMWIDKDDVAILPDKIWGNYTLILTVLHGAVTRQYALFSSGDGFNLSAFEAALRRQADDTKKIIVLLNFPNIPTGALLR